MIIALKMEEADVIKDIMSSLGETLNVDTQVLEIEQKGTCTVIDIDEQLIVDYLSIYKKHLPVLVPLFKSVVAVCKAIYNDAEELANKWQEIITKRAAKKKRDEALKRMESQLKNL